MAKGDFIQRSSLLTLNDLKCLRTDYFYNRCQECLDICPEEAFFFERGKLKLDGQKCTGCAACIGGCPTEALMVEHFDPNNFVMDFKNSTENLISCKQNTPCLAVFDTEHLITMALRHPESLCCDLSHCAECTINQDGRILAQINSRIEEAKRFLAALDLGKNIETVLQKSSERRLLLRKLFNTVGALTQDTMSTREYAAKGRIPLKTILLKNSLKEIAENFKRSLLNESFSFLSSKTIDSFSCTNCQECVQFCPTGALFSSTDRMSIYFVAGKCVGCNICNDICKSRSILDKQEFDLIDYAFERARELVHHELAICRECKIAFVYKGGEMVCERCAQFDEEFAEIFQLASEIEKRG